ncbi:toll/interleukin-1 receptor domain-containing protein [Hydrogenophaga sp.]|uniref:toll/interleukin-1 receptor domain-containing protein n=1 Tax=Hydrogenophaga sp. TaxID=1904254 RepID=UPI003F6F894E
MNRIFISYRASDGKKDADRLCADLSRLYGADQVFFDKQDLRGGLSWRSAIVDTLGTQPVVLLLITPDLLGMQHPEGGRRIDHEDDPIRGELLTAQKHGAIIVPLLTEGVPMPTAAELPDTLRFLRESHALKLRTEDWGNDLDRLVVDLREHGIAPLKPQVPEPIAPRRTLAQRVQRGLTWVGGVFVALLVLGLLLPEDEDGEPAAAVQTQVRDVSGVWWSIDGMNRPLRVQLAVNGTAVQLQTEPFPVDWYPAWQGYAQSVLSQGLVVRDVRYVGQGMLTDVMGLPRIEMPYQAYTGDGRGPLTTGSVVLQARADGQELTGELWSNGEQAATPLRLVRTP